MKKPYPTRIKYEVGKRFYNFIIIDQIEPINSSIEEFEAWLNRLIKYKLS
jgi:hypothetical protein